MQIINLTPHTIKVVDVNNQVIREYPASGIVARAATIAEAVGEVDGIAVKHTAFGEVQGLPEPQDGVIYLVSMVVAQAVKRLDIIAPDTGPTAYRENGLIVGVRNFTQYQ